MILHGNVLRHLNSGKLFISFLVLFYIVFNIQKAFGQKWPAGIHDPSTIVKCEDTYWIFGTGDGIYSIYSKDLINWQAGPTPFTKTNFPDWINNYVGAFEGTFWAPDIIFMNNQYYLYYSCSEWGTMTSTIGCVTNKTLNPDDPDYKWNDVGFLGIWSYQPGLALNAIDPSLMRGPDGKIWMVYGSFNEKGIVITEIDSVSGKPKTYTGNLPGLSIANSWTGPQSYNYGEGEGASMIYRDGYYYLFYNKGGCCAGIASTYYMVMGRSKNPKGPFLDKTGKSLKINGQPSGGTVVLKHDNSRGLDDRYFGPGHFGMYSENGIDYVTFHYYDPNGYYPNPAVGNKGGPTLGLAKLVWGEDGWPSISFDFVDEGVYTIESLFSNKVADIESQSLVDGATLFQYADSLYNTQKWIFNSLGSGEYSIQNYSNPDMYVEASGNNNESTLVITSDYNGETNQRFRTVTSPNGKSLIYPSTKDAAWGLPAATNNDIRIILRSIFSNDYTRWKMNPFNETIWVSEKNLVIDHAEGINKGIFVESNGLWSTSVFNYSWLSVEAKGEKNDTLFISFKENPNVSDRRNRIYVTSNGGQSELISIKQLGKPSSVYNSSVDTGIDFYPNPTTKNVFIESQYDGKLEIFNHAGQKVIELHFMPGKNKLDVSSLNNGLYVLHFHSNNTNLVKKLIKN